MRQFNSYATRLVLLVLHAAGAGFASPAVVVVRPAPRTMEWLPMDNQTIYRITKDETRSLEMNTSSISQSPVFITISPCSRDVRWQLRRGNTELNNDNLSIIKEYNGGDTISFPVNIENNSRYVLQLTSSTGGAAAISVRGEASRSVRMRLRVRSKRRLVVNWDQSPIDPQTTTYCVVASTKRNYTTLCAAQLDIKKYTSSLNHKLTRSDSSADCPGSDPDLTDRTASSNNSNNSSETDNIIDNNGPDTFNVYERNVKSVFRRKKFSRSTRVTDDDPAIACVGDRTHHLIENLDPSKTYYVSLFGLAADRSAGSLLATGTVKPRSSTAKRLRENLPYKADIRGKSVYYFKATVGTGGGMWLAVTTCGGAVDVEVLARGKRLHFAKNIDPHSKFFVAAPMLPSSIQQSSEEISIQFDSSSEEARLRYVIRIVPSRWERVGALSVEIVASTTRWGMNTPELSEDGAVVRELRQRRSCRSVDIAFLPATHQLTDVIRYCTTARENTNGENYTCSSTRKSTTKIQCINHTQYLPTKAIVQKINGLKAGRKYALQVTASINGNTVPYNLLYIDTNVLCKEN